MDRFSLVLNRSGALCVHYCHTMRCETIDNIDNSVSSTINLVILELGGPLRKGEGDERSSVYGLYQWSKFMLRSTIRDGLI